MSFRIFAHLFSFFPNILLRWNIGRLAYSTEETLSKLNKEAIRASKNGAISFTELNRIGMYYAIAQMDIAVLRSKLIAELNPICANVYSRQLAILLFEYIDDYSVILGRDFRLIAEILPNAASHLAALKANGLEMRKIRKQYKPILEEIRNNVAAHKDHDGTKQYRIMNSINPKDMANVAEAIFRNAWECLDIIKVAAEDYRDSPLMIKEVSKRVEQEAAVE
jgi:hypothetical protein